MRSVFFKNEEKVCYIVGAFENGDLNINRKENDIVISADGGLALLEKFGIVPDVVMGDFDSLGFVPKGENVFVYPSEKDDSDMGLAIKYGFEKGYSNFIIYGGVGGRFDHTFANIQLLSYIAHSGGRGVLVGGKTVITVLENSEISINGKGYVSVFSLSDKSEGVTIENLKYTLTEETLSNTFPLGLSNEFIDGKSSLLRVRRGMLLVVINEVL